MEAILTVKAGERAQDALFTAKRVSTEMKNAIPDGWGVVLSVRPRTEPGQTDARWRVEVAAWKIFGPQLRAMFPGQAKEIVGMNQWGQEVRFLAIMLFEPGSEIPSLPLYALTLWERGEGYGRRLIESFAPAA